MNRVPRYHQIARSLRERIAAGAPAPGERLDNQRSLAREFGVTLMTLRQALELLERDGLITRRHGLGTFVASPSIDYDILHLRAPRRRPVRAGRGRGHALPPAALRPADRQVARELGLGRARRVFALERLRLVDGRPMSLQLSYLPAEIGEEVAKADLAVTPLRQVLAFKLGIEITSRARDASPPSASTAPRRARARLPPRRRRLPLRPRVAGRGGRRHRVRPGLHSRRPFPDHASAPVHRRPPPPR